MAKGSPRALPTRAVLTAVVVVALAYLVMMRSPTELRAQTPTQEGTVRLIPAISSVPADGGPFTVFIVLEDLRHFGAVAYDDNRDTVPDRYIESDGLAAFQFTIDYDSRALSFVSVQQGPDLARTGRPFDCLPPAREANRVTFGCVSPGPQPAGPQGTLTLGTVTFEPAGAGSSPLVVQAELTGPLADAALVDVRGGVVRIVGRPAPKGTGQPAAGTPTPAVTSEPTSVSGSATVTPRATSLATSSSSRTPTPRAGNGDGGVPVVGGSSGDGSSNSVSLWLGIAVGCASAVLLTLAAVAWQRRHRAGV